MAANPIPFIPKARIELEHELLERLEGLEALKRLVAAHGLDEVLLWLRAIATVEQGRASPLIAISDDMLKGPTDPRD
jgi:hypothetical protein